MTINLFKVQSNKIKVTLFLFLSLLIFLIFRSIDYLSKYKYIYYSNGINHRKYFNFYNFKDNLFDNLLDKESFTSNVIEEDFLTDKTTHNINLPINTTYSCKNFCGPASRCAITGQQCFADIDCPGCISQSNQKKEKSECMQGDNDAGKLTIGVTPNYSPLTSGYGTKERIVTDDLYGKPAQANFGVDIWGNSFNDGQYLFNKRYKPNVSSLQFIPNYTNTYSITGEFINDGPLPSNY